MPPFPSSHKHPAAEHSRLPGWKRYLPVTREQRGTDQITHILWSQLLTIICSVVLLGYLGVVTTAWAFLTFHRGISSTRYVNFLLPSRWAIEREHIGDHHIEQARRLIAAGEYYEALVRLRVGVGKSPANLTGRQLLAELFTAARRRDLAGETLIAGLPFAHSNPDYLRATFGFLLEQQDDDVVRTHAHQLLAANHLPPASAAVVSLAAASAHYFRGNYDEAEDQLRAHQLTTTYDGRLLAAQIAWERGYFDLAVMDLNQLIDEFPANDQAPRQLSAWFRELGRTDEFRRLTVLRQISPAAGLAPRLDLLRLLRVENPERVTTEINRLFQEAADDDRLLLGLGDFAVEIGDVPLARRVYERCRELGRSREAAAFLHVEALIAARDYRGALDLTHQLLDANQEWAKRYYALFNSLQAIAYYGLGDAASAQLYLSNFLGQADLRADNLLAVAQRFVDVGARAEARETLAHAVAVDPLNQAALTRLVELDLSLNRIDAVHAHLRRLIAMRRPSPTVLRTAQARLASDLFLFSRERDATLTSVQRALATTR